MKSIDDADFTNSVKTVIGSLPGVTELYPHQLELLNCLVNRKNVIMTSPSNSGKTLPALILPRIFNELHSLGYEELPADRKVLFVTALNSLQMSMVSSTRAMKISCESVTSKNIDELLKSDVSILFIGPEVLHIPSVSSSLLKCRGRFILKVVDEVHLCKWFDVAH